MPKRTGPVHVVTTTRKHKGKTYHSYLLCRSYREGHSVLECVGHGAAMLTAVRIARPTLGFRTRRLGPNGSLERNVKCDIDGRSKSEEKMRRPSNLGGPFSSVRPPLGEAG
jgi:hypothetical protein